MLYFCGHVFCLCYGVIPFNGLVFVLCLACISSQLWNVFIQMNCNILIYCTYEVVVCIINNYLNVGIQCV